jgi:DNA invertase Pin-like site-specific DNA recombinase
VRKIGYARVSTPGQHLDRQIGALRAERCDEIFREKASAKDIRNRPQLEKAIDELGTGDVLVVAEWDRATRSMMDGVHIIERINKRGAGEGGSTPAKAPGPSPGASMSTMPQS